LNVQSIYIIKEALRKSDKAGNQDRVLPLKYNSLDRKDNTMLPKIGEGKEPSRDEIEPMLEEARMVLPGIQALFGFQLIAVINTGFDKLGDGQRLSHFASLLATLAAIALIMTPAAYHRIAEGWRASATFLRLSSLLIAVAMLALMVALTIEMILIADIIFASPLVDWVLGLVLGGLLGGLWFFWPLVVRSRNP
jgi:hypothetical protein